jgi:hypothetical protein
MDFQILVGKTDKSLQISESLRNKLEILILIFILLYVLPLNLRHDVLSFFVIIKEYIFVYIKLEKETELSRFLIALHQDQFVIDDKFFVRLREFIFL